MNSTMLVAGHVYSETFTQSFVASLNAIESPHQVKNAKKPNLPFADGSVILPNSKDLFGLKFYSVVEDGLEVTQAKGKVTVKSVKEKSAFAEAGLQVGDILVTLNGEVIKSSHELNRLSSRAIVTDGKGTLRIDRGGEKLDISVKYPPLKFASQVKEKGK
jgi:membrane-associated protease RseP (regulator of RpoE activity)